MGSHKIQIFSRTNLPMATKLPYFGNSYGYKRNLPQNNQKNFKIFVIVMQKSKISHDFHKNPTDPDPFSQKSKDPDPRNPGCNLSKGVCFVNKVRLTFP